MTSPSPLAIPDSVDDLNQAFLDERRALAPDIVAAESGLQTAEKLTDITDQWVQSLWRHTCPDPFRKSVSVIATGGYGRRQLAYHSDVDVLLAVHDDAITDDPDFSLAVERFMAWSRQTRIQISHAVRTCAQARRAIDDDRRSAIALLDLRHLTGPRATDPAFRRPAVVDQLRADDEGRRFVEQLVESLRRRIARHGQTVFLLEPDVKSGEGGLRDLHCLHWAARVRWNLDVTDNTRPNIGWTGARRRAYNHSLDELLALRNQLHLLHDRTHDRLTFRDQEALTRLRTCTAPDDPDDACTLAEQALQESTGTSEFCDERADLHPAIETRMTHYYRRARSIAITSERCLRRWAAGDDTPSHRVGPFVIGDQQLALSDGATLDDDDIFEALTIAGRRNLLLDPRLEATIEYLVDGWPGGDDAPSKLATRMRDLLVDVDAPPRTARRLLELGILSRIVPEFEPIVCHVHHDLYHVYTTDVHSLKCLEAARRLVQPDPADHRRPSFANIAADIDDTTTFLLASLFHDIGKNRGGQHSRRGAEMMRCIGPRLGLDERRVERLSKLVRHHLLLSNTSRRRDISDPDILGELAHTIESADFLDQLTALTFCDMSTVAPDVMNDWNASLLLELHHRLRHILEPDPVPADPRPPSDHRDPTAPRRSHRRRLEALVGDAPSTDASHLRTFVDGLPIDHLANTDDDALLRQYTTYCKAAERDEDFAISIEPLPDRSVTELVVTGPDRPGTLARIAGAIASVGINIMAADIVTTADGVAVDIFHVAHFNPRAVPPTNPRPVDANRRLDRLRQRITDVFADDVDVDDLLEQRRSEQRLSPRPVPAVTTEIHVDPDASSRFTVLEVRAPDRRGLLYIIAKTLFECRVDTRISRIDSLGHQAIDTFYVEEFDGQPLTDARIDEITGALDTTLADFLS